MFENKWLMAVLLALPLVVAGLAFGQNLISDNQTPEAAQDGDTDTPALAGAELASAEGVDGYICPLTGEELPCPDCCPLNDTEPVADAGESQPQEVDGYICPLTGEVLPCADCCPLNDTEPVANAGEDQPQEVDGYICPLTGEVLPCADCCPLNKDEQEPADAVDPQPAAESSAPVGGCCGDPQN